jgi:ABC-type cobalamin/Fe3+-siderophores transport system ATPase subunit
LRSSGEVAANSYRARDGNTSADGTIRVIEELNREQGRTVVMVLHDINHACRYADHVIALRAGACYAAG